MEVAEKVCADCERALALDLFATHTTGGKTYPRSRCRECFNRQRRKQDAAKIETIRKQRRESWHRNKHRFTDHAAKVARYREMARDVIAEKRNAPCVDCGQTFHSAVMEFHHRDPRTKKYEVTNAGTVKAALKEIAKCDLLCANCHRLRHFHMRGAAT